DAPACSAEEGARVRSFGTALSAPQDGAEGRPEEATNGTLCLFLSGGGGVGTSTAAAAFALRLAGKKQRVVYLNFEAFSCTDLFFQGESNYDLDDIIFSLRSKKYELQTLLRHALCRDSSGVFFLSPCRSAPDWFSLTGEELIQICHAVGKNMGAPVTLVLDMNADATENFVLPFLYAKRVVLVTNGTEAGNAKTAQLLQALPMLCNLSLFEVEKKVLLLYNRFPVENGKLLALPEPGKLGGIKQTEKDGTPKELIQKLSALSPFQRLEEHLCYG
ncbi:MAG TPA: hypothetical protein PLS28_03735, partial [Clostridiales bacterium]|nr:hypothetical protein [Clostridiales bacterium]